MRYFYHPDSLPNQYPKTLTTDESDFTSLSPTKDVYLRYLMIIFTADQGIVVGTSSISSLRMVHPAGNKINGGICNLLLSLVISESISVIFSEYLRLSGLNNGGNKCKKTLITLACVRPCETSWVPGVSFSLYNSLVYCLRWQPCGSRMLAYSRKRHLFALLLFIFFSGTLFIRCLKCCFPPVVSVVPSRPKTKVL